MPCRAALYVRNAETQEIYPSSEMELKAGMWQELDFKIPAMQGVLLDEEMCIRDSSGTVIWCCTA